MDIEGPVVVSRKGQARIERGHPWVFRSDVVKDGGATPGAVVRVADVRGEPLGFAFWSASSEIRLRMLERGEKLARRLPARPHRARPALARHGGRRAPRRIAWCTARATACRRSSSIATATTSRSRRCRRRPSGPSREIVAALVELLKPAGHRRAQRPARADARGPGADASRCCTARCRTSSRSSEGDVRCGVDLRQGQKTGLFLDQRENHLAARRYARGRVLDASATTAASRCRSRASASRGDGRRPLGRGARAREGATPRATASRT